MLLTTMSGITKFKKLLFAGLSESPTGARAAPKAQRQKDPAQGQEQKDQAQEEQA